MLDLSFAIQRFQHNVLAISALVAEVDTTQARWKPAPHEWSILEVIHHLYDEEREDFRLRLDLILHHPDVPWPPIDPEGWVTARRYNDRELGEMLAAFQSERAASLAWLGTLNNPDWNRSRSHPAAGTLHAGDLLASWLAHDTLHLRQLAQLHHQYTAHLAQPYGVRYAGEW